MTYAFHTPDKLCFILDLMNGGDLHYHLSQHGVFNESEMKFYAAEVSAPLLHDSRLLDKEHCVYCVSIGGDSVVLFRVHIHLSGHFSA